MLDILDILSKCNITMVSDLVIKLQMIVQGDNSADRYYHNRANRKVILHVIL